MPLGVKNGTARLEEHDPKWADMAQEFINQLWPVLDGYAIDIQHVGSTSINGIPAKPMLDIAVAVEDVSVAETYIDALEKIGVHFMGEIVPGQRLFYKSTPGEDDRTHHVHFVNIHSRQWENYLNMRDYCNSHPDVAAAYGNLKRKLANEYANERTNYRDGKHEFIEKVLNDARVWRENQKAGKDDTI